MFRQGKTLSITVGNRLQQKLLLRRTGTSLCHLAGFLIRDGSQPGKVVGGITTSCWQMSAELR